MVIIDTNIIARFLLRDDEKLYRQALVILKQDEVYIDEIVVAEVVWLLSRHYHVKRDLLSVSLSQLLGQKNVTNPRKSLLLQSLEIYKHSPSLSIVDCWLHVLAHEKTEILATFDQKLSRYHKQNKLR